MSIHGIEALLAEAATIANDNPEDEAQGACQVVLSNGDSISGRIDNVSDGIAVFGENEHDGRHPSFPLFIRVSHVLTFQYI
jgi:hypothetical protein